MTARTVLITGSAGHLGRALRARFESLGDYVIGIDLPGTGAEIECNLDTERYPAKPVPRSDILICNAKTATWEAHHWLAGFARTCIVNIGSIYGVLGNDPKMYEGTEVEPTPAWYAASKGALIALTKWQATNLAPVRSNCVSPGGIFRSHSAAFQERYNAKVPLKRMATEDDIVNAVEFLASDKASYINGVTLMVDGGLSVMA